MNSCPVLAARSSMNPAGRSLLLTIDEPFTPPASIGRRGSGIRSLTVVQRLGAVRRSKSATSPRRCSRKACRGAHQRAFGRPSSRRCPRGQPAPSCASGVPSQRPESSVRAVRTAMAPVRAACRGVVPRVRSSWKSVPRCRDTFGRRAALRQYWLLPHFGEMSENRKNYFSQLEHGPGAEDYPTSMAAHDRTVSPVDFVIMSIIAKTPCAARQHAGEFD